MKKHIFFWILTLFFAFCTIELPLSCSGQGIEFPPFFVSPNSDSQTGFLGANSLSDKPIQMEVVPDESPDAALAAGPAQSIRELWTVFGFSDSQRSSFIDGAAWDATDNDLAVSMLYRSRRFPLHFIDKWKHSSRQTSLLLEGLDVPEEYRESAFRIRAYNRQEKRGEIYALKGTVTAIQKIDLLPETCVRLQMSKIYAVAMQLDSGQSVIILTQTIPRSWIPGDHFNYRASANAYFLKFGVLDEPKDVPTVSYFLANRIAWHPTNSLGNLGMDFGLLEELDSQPLPKNRKIPYPQDCTLNQENRECFYQMLAACKKAQNTEDFTRLIEEAKKSCQKTWDVMDPRKTNVVGRASYPVESLFNDPVAQRGKLFWLSGRARRILAVPVEDEDIRERWGIDHYYNIYLFTSDSDNNPLALVTLELPPGVETGDGPNYAVDICAPCFFFNTWMYRHAKDENGKTLQLAPLLFAPKVLEYKYENNVKVETSDWIFILGMVIIVYFFVRSMLKNAQTRRQPPVENESVDFLKTNVDVSEGAEGRFWERVTQKKNQQP